MSENIHSFGRANKDEAHGVASHTHGPYELTREHMAKTNGQISTAPPPPSHGEMGRKTPMPHASTLASGDESKETK